MAFPSGKFKIGLLGLEDPADVRSYSGTPFHLGHYLRAAGNEVRMLGPYPLRYRSLVRVHNRLLRQLTRRELLWERHRLIAEQYPAIVDRYVEQHPDLDLLLATSVFYVAKVRTRIPVIAWGDSTVAGVIGRYRRYQRLSKQAHRRSHAVEQDGLNACDLAIFSSKWAAEIALRHYELSPAKVRVINYGANLRAVPDEDELRRLLMLRPLRPIRLLALGLDWRRKGMAKAIEIAGELRTRGLEAELQIVGCLPPDGVSVPSYVSLAGRLSKYSTDGSRRLAEALGKSHILILPTEADCASVALAEANAYGLPFISTDTGGQSSLVQQNVNGILLAAEAGVPVWADAVQWIVRDRNSYERLAWQAYHFFHRHLCWERAVSRFEDAAHALLGSPALSGRHSALLAPGELNARDERRL